MSISLEEAELFQIMDSLSFTQDKQVRVLTIILIWSMINENRIIKGAKVSVQLSPVPQLRPTLFDPTDCSLQAPPSMGFSRQEYWSGLPLPSPRMMHHLTTNTRPSTN